MGRISKEQIQERERLAKSGLKRCSIKSGCGEIKSVEDFGLNKGKWDGLRSICRTCNRNDNKKHYNENREARTAYARQYYLDNREAKNAYNRQYWIDNIESMREYRVNRIQADPMYDRLHLGKKRAEEAGAEWETIKTTELLSYWEQNNMSISTCHYCKQTIDEDELEIDHGIPIGRGGSHTLENLFPSHIRCNRQKFNKTAEEYLEHLRTEMATLYKNGVDIDRDSAENFLENFASSALQKDLYDMALSEFYAAGEFEYVEDNDVYLIKED